METLKLIGFWEVHRYHELGFEAKTNVSFVT